MNAEILALVITGLFLIVTFIVSVIRARRDCQAYKRYTGQSFGHYLMYRIKLWSIGVLTCLILWNCYLKGYIQENKFGVLGIAIFACLTFFSLLLPIVSAIGRNTELEDGD